MMREEGEQEDAEEGGEGGCGRAKEGKGREQEKREVDKGVGVEGMCPMRGEVRW